VVSERAPIYASYEVSTEDVYEGDISQQHRTLNPFVGRVALDFYPMPVVHRAAVMRLRAQIGDIVSPRVGYRWTPETAPAIKEGIEGLLKIWSEEGLLFRPEDLGKTDLECLFPPEP